MDEYTLLHYVTADGRDVFNEWLRSLRDVVAKASVIKRLNRAAQGNLGDWKPCREGVYELRFDNGYRVYYTRVASNTLLILCGGAKSTQREDIKRAVIYRRTGTRGRKMKRRRSRTHDEAMAEVLAEDPAVAVHLLNDILRDGDQQDLLIALKQMTRAYGGIPKVAAAAKLNPTQLYRTLSADGNPELRSLTAILKAMGMRLAVEAL